VPRRILLLITDLEIGGTPTVVRELATRLHAPPEVEVEVACLSKWGPVADQIRVAGVNVTALNAVGSFDWRVVWRLARLVRSRGYDTVFSFLIHANAVAAAAKPFVRGVRFLQSIQTTQPNPAWHWRLQRRVQSVAERIVVPSPSVAAVAREWVGVPEGKLAVIPNAVDPDAYELSPVPPRDPRPYPIGFIGRLDPVKRVPWLVGELHGLDVMAPGLLRLHVFGDGPERAAIEREVRRLKMDDVVTLHGFVPRPQDALRQVGMLALRSESEGFGLVLIEAMAAGVPVVANEAPGIRDVVRNGETGLLFHPSSSFESILAIRRVIEDRELRDRLIRNGLLEVRSRFSWTVVLKQYRELLGLSQG
jgi:GalNAc-alpha-(1->4)-GalNAc-alpha-(1->3)-diNAcBac-PP-undecaprenol alpha-1,4-N-acetyl-D-galactosaminyltransferase